MQLAAFTSDHFPMGHAAMLVNEGLPAYIVARARAPLRRAPGQDRRHPRDGLQGGVDDTRASLSYKLRKLLSWAGARVVCTDPYVQDERLTTLECVLERERHPHPRRAAQGLSRPATIGGKDVVDVWGALGEGIRL